MPQRSTIYEVAERSGVSTATVSRVMRNGTGFSAATRHRVLQAAAELAWLPSGPARGLASRRVGIVGVLFPDFSGSVDAESPLYLDQVIRGAERAATEAGDAVLIAATRGVSGRERALAVASKVDGLVVVARSLEDDDLAEISQHVPVAVLSGSNERHDCVSVDNAGGIGAIVRHLVDGHGYDGLAFVAGPARSPDSMARFAGYRAAVQAAGLPVPKRPDAIGRFNETGGARAVQELLDRADLPRALVFGNDQMAIGALPVLRAAGLRVPDDVAITGFDDLLVARHLALTTVRQPMAALGACAVRVVLGRIADPGLPRQAVELPTHAVLRHSCGCTTDAGGGDA